MIKYKIVFVLLLFLVTFAPLIYAEDQLVILSPHWEGIRIEFEDTFIRYYKVTTGKKLDIKWLDVGGTSDILRFIRSEFRNKPKGIGVDLLFGGGVDPFQQLKTAGLLETYKVPEHILKDIASHISGTPLYDEQYTWYSTNLAGFGIIYNKVVLKELKLPEPTTWADMAKPELYSWISCADPRKSGSAHMIYEIILQAYGWEKGWELIVAMGANSRNFTAAGGQISKDVTAGEIACGACLDSYAWEQVAQFGEDVIGYVLPRDLTVISGDSIAILKGAPNRQVAERFVEFVLSEKGQNLFMLNKGQKDGPQKYQLGKLSVLPRLYEQTKGRTSVHLNPFEWESGFQYDAQKGAQRWDILNDLVGTFVIDSHHLLKSARKRILREKSPPEKAKFQATMPISEQQVQQIIDEQLWKEPEYRNQNINTWSSLVRDRYDTNPGWYTIFQNLPVLVIFLWFVVMIKFGKLARRNN